MNSNHKRNLSSTIISLQRHSEIEKPLNYTAPNPNPNVHGLLIINRNHQTFKLLIQEPIFYLNFTLSGSLSKNLSLAPEKIILKQIIEKHFYDWSTFEEFVEKSDKNNGHSSKEMNNLFSRFQGLDELLSDSLLDEQQIQWQFFDQRQKSSLLSNSKIRETQYMENLLDPLSKIGNLQAQNVSFCHNDSGQSVILYHPGEFAYFDGGLVALITDKSLAEEICKILLMYLFYSSKNI